MNRLNEKLIFINSREKICMFLGNINMYISTMAERSTDYLQMLQSNAFFFSENQQK